MFRRRESHFPFFTKYRSEEVLYPPPWSPTPSLGPYSLPGPLPHYPVPLPPYPDPLSPIPGTLITPCPDTSSLKWDRIRRGLEGRGRKRARDVTVWTANDCRRTPGVEVSSRWGE